MKYTLLFFLLIAGLCSQPVQARITPGSWRGALQLNDSTDLPFLFEVRFEKDIPLITIHNGKEDILISEITQKGDSISWKIPVVMAEFHCLIKNKQELEGFWINYEIEGIKRIRFTATPGKQNRFVIPKTTLPPKNITGNWKVIFKSANKDSIPAQGIFSQEGTALSGTFQTERGDYRYMEGYVAGDHFRLMGFDGSHAFVFAGTVADNEKIKGEFWFGAHNYLTWKAEKNATYKLTDPQRITFMIDTTDRVYFSFYNSEGQSVALSDERYMGKVVIIQLMGSWCPICIDESKTLKTFYTQYHAQGLEIIAIDYEKMRNPVKARENAKRFKTQLDLPYEVLITGRGSYMSAHANFPQLNNVTAFPTTLYLDKTGKVRNIYTGFSGPATGAMHDALIKEMNTVILQLLAE